MFVDELKIAFARLVSQEDHNLLSISRKAGVYNSTVNRLNSNYSDFSIIPALTIQRLFPEMRVYFFRSDWPDGGGIMVGGSNHAPIANGAHAKAVSSQVSPPDPVADETTRLLLAYWRDLPQSKRFEFLMKLAELKEDAENKK